MRRHPSEPSTFLRLDNVLPNGDTSTSSSTWRTADQQDIERRRLPRLRLPIGWSEPPQDVLQVQVMQLTGRRILSRLVRLGLRPTLQENVIVHSRRAFLRMGSPPLTLALFGSL